MAYVFARELRHGCHATKTGKRPALEIFGVVSGVDQQGSGCVGTDTLERGCQGGSCLGYQTGELLLVQFGYLLLQLPVATGEGLLHR